MGTEFGLAIVKLSLQPQFQTVKKISWFLFFLLFAVSCLDDPDCYLLNNDKVGISFGVLGSMAADSLRIDSITLNGVPLTGDPVAAFISFEADRFETSSHIEIVSNGVTKVIDLNYVVKIQFVSEECGPRYILSDLQNTNHNFDSLAVVNTTPGRETSTLNIRIFRCPHPDTIGVNIYQLTMPETGKSTSRATTGDIASIVVDDVTTMYENQTVSSLRLPVNVEASQIKYAINFENGFGYDEPTRTFVVGYKVTEETRYRMCGTQPFVNDLEVLTSTGVPLDSVSLIVESDGDTTSVVNDPVTSNFNIYRCPPTNIVQLAFFNNEIATSKTITSITSDYNADILYADVRASRVQLPLNPEATSTTFTINYEDVTETLRLDYTWTAPRTTLFKAGSACSDRMVITNLSVGIDNANATIENPHILFPAVTNVNLEVTE
jgi:hypothetical protein